MKLLDFDKDVLVRHLNYDLKLRSKVKDSFKFVVNKLGEQTQTKVSDLKWDEGKNYDWAVLRSESVLMLIRKYRSHFTIFSQFIHPDPEYRGENDFCIFTFSTDRELLTDDESDSRCDNPFMDIDNSIEDILVLIKNGNSNMLWNSAAIKTPKYVEIKIAMLNESYHSIDLTIFAVEELGSEHHKLFSENEMVDMVRKTKVGDVFGRYKVIEVFTELKDEYYHGIGVKVDDKSYTKDVYCLSRYYMNEMLELVKPLESSNV
ncbi:MAG: hypothetical protein HGA35_04400 [Erysipelotrichaceae bacterium]|nr:hypothetical protein [Erysipelotrichaceae bacterium]